MTPLKRIIDVNQFMLELVTLIVLDSTIFYIIRVFTITYIIEWVILYNIAYGTRDWFSKQEKLL